MNTKKVNNHFYFFKSSISFDNTFQDYKDFLLWFENKKKEENFTVNEILFANLNQWYFDDNKGSLVHESGKFFKIEGIRVETNFGKINSWEQPIINQPEIGVLGIITKIFNGVLYFLMQAKMEPGNVNILQLSPTVQATKSNFTQVHKGKSTPYLEYFIDEKKPKVLIDQLQSEQGGRFLRKRNRNIIIIIQEDIEILPDFRWLTLGELKNLLKIDNFVNMDSRSVISTIPFVDDESITNINAILKSEIVKNKNINFDLINSITNKNSFKTKKELISWYTSQKVNYELNVKKINLSNLKDWTISAESISYNDRHFNIIAVEVIAESREVPFWTQPILKDLNIGLLGFLTKKINGVLHFLVQAKVEPGNLDIIQLSPTVSCSNINYRNKNPKTKPAFYDYFINNKKVEISLDVLQSEEGGRFYHFQNRNMIIEVDESEEIKIPDNYVFMTLNQIMGFIKYSMFDMEARSLVSCFNLTKN